MDINGDKAYFSDICIEKCRGRCCDPWWGIIVFTIKKEGGLTHLNAFKNEIARNLLVRMERIREGYVTKEAHPRHLFDKPQRCNAHIEDIKGGGNSLSITIRAMFAFQCRFLSSDKKCLLHPFVIGGQDIRPPHCGFMGSPKAIEGEKGYCRIIHTAAGTSARASDAAAINTALGIEQDASSRHFEEGCLSIEKAAEQTLNRIKEYCQKHSTVLLPIEKKELPGRNEPCYCGSGTKYKKCHG